MNASRRTQLICLLLIPVWLGGCGQGENPQVGDQSNSKNAEVTPPAQQEAVPSEPVDVDSDGDGVPDSVDACDNTVQKANVDAQGCEFDADGDRVVDSVDECPETSEGVEVGYDGCASLARDRIFVPELQFASGSVALKRAEVEAEFTDLLNQANTYTSSNIVVTGYTDNQGAEEANRKLSERRAQAVADLLSELGLNAQRISAVGKGENDPIGDNDTAAGRAQNRRIEITLKSTDDD